MSEIIRRLAGPRLVSPSVRAAEKLPSSIKSQSVKNQLLRAGAKPLELEYAQFDDWLKDQGGTVTNEQVRDHLASKGPLGRLQRLDQAGETPPVDDVDRGERLYDEDEEDALNEAEYQYDQASEDAKMFMANPHLRKQVYEFEQPRMPASDVAMPEKENVNRWPYTMYAPYTESAAHGWNDARYRESLWFDPATKNPNRPWRSEAFDPRSVQRPHSAHDSDMWVRYHINANPPGTTGKVIDVQNIQSDIGQDLATRDLYKRRRDRMTDKDAELWDGYRDVRERAETESAEATRRVREFLEPLRESIAKLHFDITGAMPDERSLTNLIQSMSLDRTPAAPGRRILRALPDVAAVEGDTGFRDQLRALIASREKAWGAWQDAGNHATRFEQELRQRGVLPPSQYAEDNIRSRLRGIEASPLFRDDNWMQIPLRQIALESAVRGGAPIRLPLGANVRVVENMPKSAARGKYEHAFVRGLQNIFKPIGGSEVVRVPGVRKLTFEQPNHYGDYGETNTRTIFVGPNDERAGTTVIPSRQAVEYINKHGLDILSLLLMAGGGSYAAGNSNNNTPVSGLLQ